jgi:hypothetical protein
LLFVGGFPLNGERDVVVREERERGLGDDVFAGL